MPSIDSRALVAFATLGWRRAVAERTSMLGLVLVYALILSIFWGLWRATPLAELASVDMTPATMLWYMAITECVAVAVGFPYRGVEAEIQSGSIATSMIRPVPYGLATLAEWCGQTAYRVLLLSAVGAVLVIWMTGTIPFSLSVLPVLFLSMALGCLCALLCQLQLGYATVWIGSAAPPFWIWQKLLFVFGGLIVPLSLYPDVLRRVASVLPFAGILFAPGSLAFRQSNVDIVLTLSQQLVWVVALSCAAWFVDRSVSTRIATRGV